MVATRFAEHLLEGDHASRPAAGDVPEGTLYACSDHPLIYQSDTSTWSTWATLGTSGAIVDPMTTRGDIIIRNASNVTARLARGSATHVLTSDGTDIGWAAPSGGSATFHGARVYNNAAIAVNPTATLTFNSERFDTDAYHDTGTNPGRLTVPTGLGGKHIVNFVGEWAANATGYRQFGLRVNGTTYIALDDPVAVSGGQETRQAVTAGPYNFAVGDYVEVIAAQTSGGSLNVNAGGNYSPEFSITYLGA